LTSGHVSYHQNESFTPTGGLTWILTLFDETFLWSSMDPNLVS